MRKPPETRIFTQHGIKAPTRSRLRADQSEWADARKKSVSALQQRALQSKAASSRKAAFSAKSPRFNFFNVKRVWRSIQQILQDRRT
jgi:hypothetical protein